MCLATLPSEIVLLVVDHLVDVADVVSLQLSCKRMNALISDAPQVLWKRQLENECSRNALFWPSFARIRSGAAFKKAATSGYRLSNAYERAVTSESGIRMTSRTLAIPQHPKDPRETRLPIEETWLVPGGRFLVVFRENSLEIVDISLSTPDVVYLMALAGVVNSGFQRIVYQNVVDKETFHIIYETFESESFDEDLLEPNEVVVSYVFLEFTAPGAASFHLNIKGQAVVVHSKYCSLGGISVAGNNVAFLFDELTVLWSTKNNVHIGWFLSDLVDVSSMDIILSKDTVVYIAKDAVCGVQIPSIKAIKGSEIIWAQLDEQDVVLAPNFSLPHAHISESSDDDEDSDDEDAEDEPLYLIASASINLVDEKQEISYEIREAVELREEDDPEGDVLSYSLHHRYKFKFNTTNPGASYLEHISSLPVIAQQNIDEEGTAVYEGLEPQPFQTAGRSACSLWTDRAVGPAFLSNYDWELEALDVSNDHIALVPLALPSREPEWGVHVSSSMCAASARVVAVWRSVSEENADEVVDRLVVYELE